MGVTETIIEKAQEITTADYQKHDNDSIDSNARYAAYANRLRILRATHRYVAYTSDIGESFRPVAHPIMVSSAYAVSWAYIIADVSLEGWKAKMRQEGRYKSGLLPWHDIPAANTYVTPNQDDLPDYRVAALQRGVFQSIASMALPAFTIHSTVRYSGAALKNVKNPTIRIWGPVGLGLAVVPLLPYLFDKPVEEGIDYLFEQGTKLYKEKTKTA